MASSSTSSSESRGGRGAFRIALVAILLIEASIAGFVTPNRGRHIVDDLLADLETRTDSRPVVLLGDSVTANCIEGLPGSENVHDLACTAAIGFPGFFFLYRRLRETAPPPRDVFLVVIPEVYSNQLARRIQWTYFESCFTRPEEIAHFLRTSGRRGQALRIAAQGALLPPSVKARGTIARSIAGVFPLAGDRRSGRWLVPPTWEAGDVPRLLAGRAARRDFVFSRLQADYLDAIADVVTADGARLHLVTGALPRSVARGWTLTGYARQYEDALRRFADAREGVDVVAVDRFAVFADGDFHDKTHLVRERMPDYGARLLRFMMEPTE